VQDRRLLFDEDIVGLVFLSFSRSVAESRFIKLEHRDDVWQLLSLITVRQVYNRHRHWARKKRAAEQGPPGGSQTLEPADPGPPPEFQVMLEDLIARLPRPYLKETGRLLMEGHDLDTIAQRQNCSRRTIERRREAIRMAWEQGATHE
jgi:DNA-directed RNA polymerase specialized sigma24 family protein